jgi:hypothetical protein
MPLPSLRSAKDTTGTTCTLWFIRRELGQHGYSDRRMVAYVTQLIDQHDFPRPLPAMCKGGALTSAVTSNSTWPRAAVEAWIEGWLPRTPPPPSIARPAPPPPTTWTPTRATCASSAVATTGGCMSEQNPFLSPGSPKPLGILSDRIGLNDPASISAMGDALGMNKLAISLPFAHQWLRSQYGKPVYEQNRWEVTAPPEVIGFNQIDASRALILACCMRGSYQGRPTARWRRERRLAAPKPGRCIMTRRLIALADRAIIAANRLPAIVLIMALVLILQLLGNVALVISEAAGQ